MITNNIALLTDSYKPSHYKMLLEGTETVYSYGTAREGSEFEKVIFFGLQAILMQNFTGQRFFFEHLEDAAEIYEKHLGPEVFNKQGWKRLIEKHNGRLPIEIWAVPEGSINKPGDPLYVAFNTDPEFPWLTSYVESILMHVWYPTTVASLSYSVKETIRKALEKTTGSIDGIDFMLHDFGFRGASSKEAAALGGLAHLVNFKGTDTVPALWLGRDLYSADLDSLGFSIPAAEHTIMTQLGPEGESEVFGWILEQYPTGLLAAPIDSYDYFNFVENIAGKDHYETIMNRDGKFVFRPDSLSPVHETPEDEMLWLAETLWNIFGGTFNELGYRVLDPHVGMLWGDGIDAAGIERILYRLAANNFATSNIPIGMGGGLLQKINRDTMRFAFKSSAQKRNGEWYDISKQPLDKSKASKAGIFDPEIHNLELVFKDGELLRYSNFETVRERVLS